MTTGADGETARIESGPLANWLDVWPGLFQAAIDRQPIELDGREVARVVLRILDQSDDIARLTKERTDRDSRIKAEAIAKRDREWQAAYCKPGGAAFLGPRSPEELTVYITESRRVHAEVTDYAESKARAEALRDVVRLIACEAEPWSHDHDRTTFGVIQAIAGLIRGLPGFPTGEEGGDG